MTEQLLAQQARVALRNGACRTPKHNQRDRPHHQPTGCPHTNTPILTGRSVLSLQGSSGLERSARRDDRWGHGVFTVEAGPRVEIGPYTGHILEEDLLVLETLRNVGGAGALVRDGEQADVAATAVCDLYVQDVPARIVGEQTGSSR